MPHPKAHGILVLYGITADEAQLAISDSWSVLQEQEEYQVPSAVHDEMSTKQRQVQLTLYLELRSSQVEVGGTQ